MPRKKKATLSQDWQLWIAENKIRGVSDEILISTLVNQGFALELVETEVAKASSHPYIAAGYRIAEKQRKHEALMDLQNNLGLLSRSYGRIFVEENLSREEFLELYYSKNIPVVINGLMKNWPALNLWTLDYLKSKFGNEIVEIQMGRNSDPIYEENSDYLKQKISFGEYIDMILQGGETNDYYMTANNHVIENAKMKALLSDIEIFPEFLRPDHKPSELFFWLGPAGTITPLHHDRQNIFMAQVMGRKLIKLVAPEQTHLVYNHRTVFSQVDCENPNFERFPLFQKATVITGVLNPGQVLFLPNAWWHYVRALDISTTVTFTNFIYPNPIFEW